MLPQLPRILTSVVGASMTSCRDRVILKPVLRTSLVLVSHLVPSILPAWSSALTKSQPNATPTFNPVATQRHPAKPAELLAIHPPLIPPNVMPTIAPTLLHVFLLGSFFLPVLPSARDLSTPMTRSQYTLVNTVVGTSPIPHSLLVTICPPD